MTATPEVSTADTLSRSRELVVPALREAVQRLDPSTRLVVSYHLGWCDEHGVARAGSGGKAVRPALALLAAEAVGGTADEALPGAVAVELVHNFSLVHDDLMDRDAERRHRATVWALWGDATAVLAGDAMLSLAHEVLLDSASPYAAAAGRTVATATRDLIRGQAQDVAFERRDDVSLAECMDMAVGKTGSLLAASAAVGAELAGAPGAVVTALSDFGRHVGLAFQLVDDVLGIWGRPETTGKPVHSDLRSRKKSLPITWAVEHGGAAGRELAEWLREPDTAENADLTPIADLVARSGAREWTLAEARRRVELADTALQTAAFGAPALRPGPSAALRDLARFIVDRES